MDNRQNQANINWYPGHMAKTRKQIEEDLKIVDIVIELLDARIPISSQNPNISEITKKKKKLIVLNKSDLADENQNKLWLQYFKNKKIPAIIVDSNSGKGIEKAIQKIEEILKDEIQIQTQKGRIGRKIRAMVVGIPNVRKIIIYKQNIKKNNSRNRK